jgi:hypothetical protein
MRRSVARSFSVGIASFIFGLVPGTQAGTGRTPLASLETVLEAKADLWGEAAMAAPDGASYEFFERLLPPPRYVNADFLYYPIVLSAPNAKVKARLISNGSGVNLSGGARSWNATGTPVIFRVGPDEFKFGDIPGRLEHPRLAKGYLPIPSIRYAHASEVYELEAFASTDPQLIGNGVVLVKFSLVSGTNGHITVEIDSKAIKFANGTVSNGEGQTLAWFDASWTWERERAHAVIGTNKFATMAIASRPVVGGETRKLKAEVGNTLGAKDADQNRARSPIFGYETQREMWVATWERLLAGGMQVETPEPIVNHAWRNLIVQNFSIIHGDRMNYSAGNQYEKMYAAESSDAALPLLWWGYQTDFKRLLRVILDLADNRLPHHFVSHKLDDICHFYWQTRDAEFVNAMRPRWQKDLDSILNGRTGEHGLLPKENYCTDIEVPVYSFTANAKCWAALRDIAPVLKELGEPNQARRITEAAAEFKQQILAAVEANTRSETKPPFIPMALFYGEEIHDPITEMRLGSYWDLIANYAVGSRIFAGSERELWLPRYFEEHGGLCMGLTRSAAASHTFWTGKHRTNPLYGMRYILDALRRDDPERALVSFYGMLAHGMTRNTFIGAEGCSIQPLDEGGRFFYCPPNSSSNGQWLAVLRYLLVQDWDSDQDGEPDSLRLLFATPRRWLADGKTIRVERAPTAFGPVSIRAESRLNQGEVQVEVDLPERNAAKTILLRARVPEGWKVTSATAGSVNLKVNDRGTVDVTPFKGKQTIRFAVTR